MSINTNYLGLSGSDLEHIQAHEELLSKRVLKNPDEARLQALLWWVIWRGSIEQLRELLAAGADPNFLHNDLNTSLGLVIRWRSEKAGAEAFFRELIRAGADPTRSAGNKTLMTAACEHGNTQWAIGPLLELTPREKMPKADLNRALLAAAHDASLTKRLLTAGASVSHQQTISNACISTAVSALMVATFFANHHVVELLLTAGADVNLKDDEGHTAHDYALVNPKTCRKVIPLLEKAGGVSAKPFPRDDDPFRGF